LKEDIKKAQQYSVSSTIDPAALNKFNAKFAKDLGLASNLVKERDKKKK
jgi:hypothetical protein